LQAQWDQRLNELFSGAVPSHAEWTALDAIVSTLRAVAGNLNHVFFPSGGGQDLMSCRATQDGLLEWSYSDNLDRSAYVCKPVKLVFWNPGVSTREANFVLEVTALQPLDPAQEDSSREREEVVELGDGRYAPRYAWDEDEYQGETLDASARLLVRRLAPGRFAIFGKGSNYNLDHGNGFDAYLAPHNDPARFRVIVERMAAAEG